MTAAETREALVLFYDALSRRDAATMAAMYAPDAAFEDPVFRLRGREIGRMWTSLLGRAREFSVTYTIAAAREDYGAVEWTARYLFGGRRPVVNTIVSELRFADGRIAEQRDAFDFARWAAQALGLPGRLFGRFDWFRRALSRKASARLRPGVRHVLVYLAWAWGQACTCVSRLPRVPLSRQWIHRALRQEAALARAVRIDVSGGIYHVIARGNERKKIFRDDDDRRIYLGRLAECQTQLRFRLLAYCLMSNHVHLAIQRGPRPLSRIMLSLQSFYAQRYNFRHGRVGHLFGERYKAFLIDHETYLFALVRYIHWNPVRAGIVGRASAYRWSSDRFYRFGGAPSWLHTDRLLDALAARREEAVRLYKRLMADAARQTYEELEAYGRVIKGTRRFAERALLVAGRPDLRPSPSPEALCRAVAEVEGFTLERLREPGGGRDASRTRLIAAYLAERDAGICLAATARVFGREASTFSRGVRRLEDAMAQDTRLEARIGEIRRLVGESTEIHA